MIEFLTKYMPTSEAKLLLDLFFMMIQATIVGGSIGLEREFRGKHAGLKTFILICAGSTIFTYLSSLFVDGDPSRVAAQIVSGVGFLGAGAIFKDKDRVSGLTTAAFIWIVAAFGVMIGTGHGIPAVILGFGMLIAIYAVSRIESLVHKLRLKDDDEGVS